MNYSCQVSMIFNFIQTQFVLLKTNSGDDGVGVAIALTFMFVMLLILVKAFIDFRRDLAAEKGNAKFQDVPLRRIERILAGADEILRFRSPYYNRLSDFGKKRFLKRLRIIIAEKEFYGKDGLEITDDMIVLASSALVQLTFGLESYFLPRFYRIYIHPSIFFNKLLESNLRGSTSPSGVIRFSWRHLEHGFQDEDDRINLALHELAHALMISVESGDTDDGHLSDGLFMITELGRKYRNDIKAGRYESIRPYAASNDHEFFACCIEVFFENPERLKRDLPEVYEAFVWMLEQDPHNRLGDYAAPIQKREFSIKRKLRLKPDSHYNYVQTMLIAGFLLCWIPIIMINIHVETSPLPVALFAATLAVLGFILFFRKLVLSGYTDFNIFLLFLVIGWMSLTMGAGLTLNYFVPVYRMSELAPVSDYFITPEKKLRVLIDGEETRAITVGLEYRAILDRCKPHCEMTIYQHYGLFGIKVVDEIEVFESNEGSDQYQ